MVRDGFVNDKGWRSYLSSCADKMRTKRVFGHMEERDDFMGGRLLPFGKSADKPELKPDPPKPPNPPKSPNPDPRGDGPVGAGQETPTTIIRLGNAA